jgi:penicillin-binding protein 1C
MKQPSSRDQNREPLRRPSTEPASHSSSAESSVSADAVAKSGSGISGIRKSSANLKPKTNIKPLTKAEQKAARKKQRPRWKRWLIRLGITLAIVVGLGLVSGVTVFAWFAKDLPSTDQLESRVLTESTKIYDRTGEHLLYETGKDVRRTYTKLENISEDLRNATIAVEDKNYYNHYGFDPIAILRSAGINVASDRQVGGSTITQQFVKMAIVGDERTYSRKIKEVILSVELERQYGKDKILEFYLNEAPYGGINLGVAAGAQSYFEKSPSELTLAQAAFLAAVPQKPSRITQDYETLLERKDFVLDRMVEEGYITTAQAAAAKTEPIELKQTIVKKEAPHFVDYVISQLEDDFGANFINQGLHVTTTLDYNKQSLAEEAISNGIPTVEDYGGSNAALVSLDAHNGQILAMVGSKDYYSIDYDGQVNVTVSPRQPGSSFKPVVYVTAFANGYNPNTVLFDVETDFPTETGNYHPRNYSLGASGPLTMRRTLSNSLNIPAVKTLYLAGKDKVLDTADALGYSTLGDRDRFGLALALGGGEVKLLEHASAFATFAREGERHATASILKVEDRSGNVLYEWGDSATQVLDKTAVQNLNSVLSDQAARGSTFRNLNISGKTIAGKTGTTNDFHDAWTIMYTPSFVTGVWTGNNDNTEMDYGADGVFVAAPIANAYMSKILEGLSDETFTAPPTSTANKGVLSGQIGEKVEKYVDTGTQHIISDDCVASYPAEFKEKKEFKEAHTILHYLRKEDPLGSPPADPTSDPMYASWEKAVQLWAEGQDDYITEKTEYEDCNLRSADQTPTVTITAPGNGTTVTSATFAIQTRIHPGTNRSVKQVEYLIDNSLVDVQTSQPFESDYLPTALTSGKHTLTVRVANDRDNIATSSVSFTYDIAVDSTSNTNTNKNSNSNSNNSNKTNSNQTDSNSNTTNKNSGKNKNNSD